MRLDPALEPRWPSPPDPDDHPDARRQRRIEAQRAEILADDELVGEAVGNYLARIDKAMDARFAAAVAALYRGEGHAAFARFVSDAIDWYAGERAEQAARRQDDTNQDVYGDTDPKWRYA